MLPKMPVWLVNAKICLHQLGITSCSQRKIPPMFTGSNIKHYTGDKPPTLCMYQTRHARGQSVSMCAPEHSRQLSGCWKYFSPCWVPSQAALNSATLVTDHFLHLAPQWGVNISELMHKSCTPGFPSATAVRHNSWVFLNIEEHGLFSDTANGKIHGDLLMFNAQTGSANSWKPLPPSHRQHLRDVLQTRVPCQDWQTPQAVSTHGCLLGPHVTERKHMELIHPNMNTQAHWLLLCRWTLW